MVLMRLSDAVCVVVCTGLSAPMIRAGYYVMVFTEMEPPEGLVLNGKARVHCQVGVQVMHQVVFKPHAFSMSSRRATAT